MRSSLEYTGFAQLCGRSPIMREIMRAHNRIIPRSLVHRPQCRTVHQTSVCLASSMHCMTNERKRLPNEPKAADRTKSLATLAASLFRH